MFRMRWQQITTQASQVRLLLVVFIGCEQFSIHATTLLRMRWQQTTMQAFQVRLVSYKALSYTVADLESISIEFLLISLCKCTQGCAVL
jgi:hypothetical protein